LHCPPRASPKRIVNPARSKPISQTSGHNNLIPESRRLTYINDQDHRSAWSFTLIHELAHLWLGTTGVSGGSADIRIEKFCNDVAAGLLLPRSEIASVQIDRGADLQSVAKTIGEFAEVRRLSRSMVAYNLARAGVITDETWLALAALFRAQWRQGREAQRERQRDGTGPNYYVVRRHRLGTAFSNSSRAT
jgi:Zn-dependent peptidase ImmA (M78 family)